MNQKDIKKTGLNPYGHAENSSIQSFQYKPLSLVGGLDYDFINKKTEKLVTALYMVTDCMEKEDAIKDKLRHLGVDFLSNVYKISNTIPTEKRVQISTSISLAKEIMSLVEIASIMYFISEMNGSILKKEFSSIVGLFDEEISKDKHFTFTLNEDLFEVGDMKKNDLNQNLNIKDKNISQNTMSFKNPITNFVPKKLSQPAISVQDKQDRSNKILSLIKDKKEVSIKDISIVFNTCSEKTIQRELNSLVSKGHIKKTGAKRWSKYQLA